MFAIGDFKLHYIHWLTYYGGTDSFAISNDLTRMVNFPTWFPDCNCLSPALLDLFLLMIVFVLQWRPSIGKI